jgi:hypothetical protein
VCLANNVPSFLSIWQKVSRKTCQLTTHVYCDKLQSSFIKKEITCLVKCALIYILIKIIVRPVILVPQMGTLMLLHGVPLNMSAVHD